LSIHGWGLLKTWKTIKSSGNSIPNHLSLSSVVSNSKSWGLNWGSDWSSQSDILSWSSDLFWGSLGKVQRLSSLKTSSLWSKKRFLLNWLWLFLGLIEIWNYLRVISDQAFHQLRSGNCGLNNKALWLLLLLFLFLLNWFGGSSWLIG
jgi:hypothetical protein